MQTITQPEAIETFKDEKLRTLFKKHQYFTTKDALIFHNGETNSGSPVLEAQFDIVVRCDLYQNHGAKRNDVNSRYDIKAVHLYKEPVKAAKETKEVL